MSCAVKEIQDSIPKSIAPESDQPVLKSPCTMLDPADAEVAEVLSAQLVCVSSPAPDCF